MKDGQQSMELRDTTRISRVTVCVRRSVNELRMCIWTEWFYVGDLISDAVSKVFVLDVDTFCDVVGGILASVVLKRCTM